MTSNSLQTKMCTVLRIVLGMVIVINLRYLLALAERQLHPAFKASASTVAQNLASWNLLLCRQARIWQIATSSKSVLDISWLGVKTSVPYSYLSAAACLCCRLSPTLVGCHSLLRQLIGIKVWYLSSSCVPSFLPFTHYYFPQQSSRFDYLLPWPRYLTWMLCLSASAFL